MQFWRKCLCELLR